LLRRLLGAFLGQAEPRGVAAPATRD
jgi:hypothetical protein